MVTEMLREDFTRKTSPLLSSLYNRAYARVGNREDAEDRVQETLCKAWRYWESRRGPTVGAWLMKILDRVLLDHHRAMTTQRRPPLINFTDVEINAQDVSFIEHLAVDPRDPCILVVRESHLASLLRCLEPFQRECINLCCGEGMTYYEASVEMCVPTRSVHVAVLQARKRLRQLLAEEESSWR